ncbi:MAG: alpha-glucosidase [Deltaproteobacteria bacterium]|nr:alpha-glucosidase [Deltaproteobacteria bacterium]
MSVTEEKTTPKWFKDAVVYQIYPRSFLDTNGDGIGDLNGITEKLDYLNDGTPNSLGIDAIWITPLYPSPQYDFGYDVMDYRGVDPQYGTMEDFDRLLREAHKRGIRIIMDMVPNHTSHLHPWFLESRSSKDNPKRDWYIWRPRPKGRKYPNNWLGIFGGRAWEWDNKTKEYYYHTSVPEQPDLNWRNPQVREAILSDMAFWLDKGVDGYRLDVINWTMKDKELKDNPHCIGRRPYDMQRHLYDKDQQEAVDVAKAMRELTDRYKDKILVGEVALDHSDPREAARYLGENGDGLHATFNFSFTYSRFGAERFKAEVSAWEEAVGKRGWPTYVLSNHDEIRHISRYAKGRWTIPRARVLAAMLLTLRGTPFLYYGEEIGMRNLWPKRSEILDPLGKRYWPFHPGRDGERTPMQWNGSKNAGFSTGEPWLRVHPNFRKINVDIQDKDPNSLLNLYRRLIWIRKENSALREGSYKEYPNSPTGIFSFFRQTHEQHLFTALNFTKERKSFTIDQANAGKAKIIFSEPEFGTKSLDAKGFEIPPYGILILEM